MSVEDAGDWSSASEAIRTFARPALVLAGAISAIALPLGVLSIITEQTGTGGPWGVVAAAGLCFVAGLSGGLFAAVVRRASTPLAGLLVGMAFRLTPPMFVCLVLAMRGGGREHLAFVVYLLSLYLVTLTIDTWWAVQRTGATQAHGRRCSS